MQVAAMEIPGSEIKAASEYKKAFVTTPTDLASVMAAHQFKTRRHYMVHAGSNLFNLAFDVEITQCRKDVMQF